jgi:hypothetical protein
MASLEIENENETEEKFAEYVDLLFQSKEFIRKLAEIYDITLWVTSYQEKYQYNLRFSKTVLAKISEMGIDVGITAMQLQAFYDGTYLPE